jgi:SprT-like family
MPMKRGKMAMQIEKNQKLYAQVRLDAPSLEKAASIRYKSRLEQFSSAMEGVEMRKLQWLRKKRYNEQDTDVLFKGSSDDDRINSALVAHAIQHREWPLLNLYWELEQWVNLFNTEFFNSDLQPTALSLDYGRRNTLGTYKFDRDGLALQWRININAHYKNAPLAFLLSVLLHELVHQWEYRDQPLRERNRGRYHSSTWRHKAADLGISTIDNQKGIWQEPDPNGKFANLLRRHGVDPLDLGAENPHVKGFAYAGQPANSTKPWICSSGCTRVYVARKTILEATCNKCGKIFAPV